VDALSAAYQPGRTLAQAFGEFYRRAFAAQGLLVLDAAGREAHTLGAPVLAAAIEQADELHAALLERNRALAAAGFHAQVAVTPQSSLLFLIDAATGARTALKRNGPTAAEPNGLWQAGRMRFSTADLLGILAVEPERISPAALLRPLFQDLLLSTSLTIGGPAEIAYFAQSAVLFERILGRVTPAQPRFSATLVEPAVAKLLARHALKLEQVLASTPDALAQMLALRASPVQDQEERAGAALEAELEPLLAVMAALDEGLGRSAATAASKMRYQIRRIRRLATNFQLQREASLGRAAGELAVALYPLGGLQERLHGAAYYFAKYGFELAEGLVNAAADQAPGHAVLWL
jgi:uncharacterized protein YllA (UPF0747 family)